MIEQRITAAWLRQTGAPSDQVERFAELFPEGCPVSLEAALQCEEQGLDMVCVGCQLMTPENRGQFMFFTLHQRQPHLVALFEIAKLPVQARAIGGINWGDTEMAGQVLQAAHDATSDSHSHVAASGAHAIADAARDHLAIISAFANRTAIEANAAYVAAYRAADAADAARKASYDARRDARKAAAIAASYYTIREAQIKWIWAMLEEMPDS